MDSVRQLTEWGKTVSLPFWAERGWDRRHGGFYETLRPDGEGVAGDLRRVRVQARQAYVFARSAHEGWLDRADLATDGMDRLVRLARGAGGEPGWAHTLHDDGRVADARRDLYDHAFLILALAWLFRVTGLPRYRDLAFETLAFLDTHMSAEHGGYREAIGAACLPRRQNPHMHLFEALMALYEATGEDSLLLRLDAIRQLFDRHFFDPAEAVLREFFDAQWQPDRETGDRIEPGHLCEWVWLLAEHERLTGQAAGAAAEGLFATAMKHGINPRTGLLYTTIAPDGAVLDAGSRTWMQTEWIRAAAVRAMRGAADAPARLAQACAAANRHHFQPAIGGGWVDAVSAAGEPVASGMPSSTLYHVLGSLVETDRVLSAVPGE